jgi:hypothetical protein
MGWTIGLTPKSCKHSTPNLSAVIPNSFAHAGIRAGARARTNTSRLRGRANPAVIAPSNADMSEPIRSTLKLRLKASLFSAVRGRSVGSPIENRLKN